MKKIVVAITVLMLIITGGCGQSAVEPVVKTITMKTGSGIDEYSIIYDNGKIETTERFAADEATFLYADAFDFESDIDGGKVTVSLKDTKLIDADGNSYVADETEQAVLQCIADNAEHDIFDVMIIEDAGNYFVFEKQNVNLQTPCVLYKYDENEGMLEELYQWEDVDLRERKRKIETAKLERQRDEKRVAALRESVEKAKDKVLAYDEQLVRNFIEEIKVFPNKLTITVTGGTKEDIAI